MQNRVLVGISCLCLGVLIFSLQDALIKDISHSYPVTEAIAIRATVGLPILVFIVHYEGGLGRLLSERAGFLILRAVIMFAAYGTYYLAFPALPLADAVALFFTAPLFIMALAGPYLGERIHWKSLLAVLVGMAGVIVMLRPGAAVFEWAGLLSLASALLYAIPQLMARKVGDEESAAVMTFYQNAVYLIGALVLALVFATVDVGPVTHPSLQFLVRPWAWPSLADFSKMAACGVIAAVAMLLLSQAYRLAPANRVAIYEYTGILWSPLWGFLFFAEIPHATTVVGAALIIGAGIFALRVGRDGGAAPVRPEPGPPAGESRPA